MFYVLLVVMRNNNIYLLLLQFNTMPDNIEGDIEIENNVNPLIKTFILPIEMLTQKTAIPDSMKTDLELVKTDDILKSISAKKKNQFVVGFALETNDEKINAKEKLVNKNLDVIVLNSLNDKGGGFGHDTNKVTIITKNDEQEYDLKTKSEVASDILNHIEKSI